MTQNVATEITKIQGRGFLQRTSVSIKVFFRSIFEQFMTKKFWSDLLLSTFREAVRAFFMAGAKGLNAAANPVGIGPQPYQPASSWQPSYNQAPHQSVFSPSYQPRQDFGRSSLVPVEQPKDVFPAGNFPNMGPRT
jgi:hypothetical protein